MKGVDIAVIIIGTMVESSKAKNNGLAFNVNTQ